MPVSLPSSPVLESKTTPATASASTGAMTSHPLATPSRSTESAPASINTQGLTRHIRSGSTGSPPMNALAIPSSSWSGGGHHISTFRSSPSASFASASASSSSSSASSSSGHILPPLPPLPVAFPSPVFTSKGMTHTYHSANNLNTHARPGSMTAAPSPSLPPSTLTSRPVSPSLHGFGLTPTNAMNISVAPPLGTVSSGSAICSCKNEPGSAPCNCTPVQNQRSIVMSRSMDAGFNSNANTNTNPAATAAPTVLNNMHIYSPITRSSSGVPHGPISLGTPSASPTPRHRPMFSLPVHLINSGTQGSGNGTSPHAAGSPISTTRIMHIHGSPMSGSATPVSVERDRTAWSSSPSPSTNERAIAAMGMPLAPSDMPVMSVPGSIISDRERRQPSISLSQGQSISEAGPPHTQMNVNINRPISPAMIHQSLLSPTAPSDLHQILQRQPSVSPVFTPLSSVSVTPAASSASPPTLREMQCMSPVSEGGRNVGSIGGGIEGIASSSAPAPSTSTHLHRTSSGVEGRVDTIFEEESSTFTSADPTPRSNHHHAPVFKSPHNVVAATNENTNGTVNVPLTASTLRLLKKAIAVLRTLFPSDEDITNPESLQNLGSLSESSSSSNANTPADSPRVTRRKPIARQKQLAATNINTQKVSSPKPCCAPPGAVCRSCSPPIVPAGDSTSSAPISSTASPSSSTTPAASSTCECVTSPLFCYCAHNLHSICTAPAFALSSDYILTGHRGTLNVSSCIRSLTQLHNESANIYSHLIGSAWMAHHWWNARGHWCLRIQAIASSALFLVSAFAHTFGVVSPEWNSILFRLDRCSIAATNTAIAVSTTLIHYDLPEKRHKRAALVALNILIGIWLQRILSRPETPGVHGDRPPNSTKPPPVSRLTRTILLLTQGFIIFVPAIFEVISTSQRASDEVRALLRRYMTAIVLCSLGSSVLYATFWPESWLHRIETENNRERVRKMKEQNGGGGGVSSEEETKEEIYACSRPQCCSLAPRYSASSSFFSSSSQALAVSSSTPFLRALRWFTDHFLHSHHLMHLSVITVTHLAFVWCAKWKFLKLALRQQEAAAAAGTAAAAAILGK